MQDVDAKRSAFGSGPRSHETHAVLTDNRTDSLRRVTTVMLDDFDRTRHINDAEVRLGHKDPRRGEASIQPPSGLLPGMQHDVVIFDNKACRLAALGTNPLARWVGRMESVSTESTRFTAPRFAATVHGHL